MSNLPRKPKRAPKGRRARGTGTIFPATRRGKPVWIGRKPVGRTATGKTVYKEVRGATQAEVVKRLAEAGPPKQDITVGAWVARWFATLQLKPRTVMNYRDDFDRHILPALGHLRVADVKPSHVEALAVTLANKGLGTNSVRKALIHARIAFNAAVRDELISRNPVSLARKPKAVPKDVDPFSPVELAGIIEAAGAQLWDRPIALLAACGCRVGEALALDVTDFDPAAHTISITRTYHKVAGLGPPKTPQSVRTIRVPDVVLPVLAAAVAGRKTGPLFVTTNDTRRNHELVFNAWAGVVKRVGLRYRNVHQMRHSVATALIAEGVPITDVAAYLGDKTETIVKTYLHPTKSDPADALDRLYGGRKVGTANSPRRKTG
jgi:integrase